MKKAFIGWGIALSLVFCLAWFMGPDEAQVYTQPPPAGTVNNGCVFNTVPPTLAAGNSGFVQCDSQGRFFVTLSGGTSGGAGFPGGATPVTSSATGTTGAVVATLPAVAAKFTYICGFYADGNEGATGAVVAVTVAGTISGSMTFNISHSVTPSLGVATTGFTPCVPSSAVNTAITVTSAADAAGTNVSVSAWGFQL